MICFIALNIHEHDAGKCDIGKTILHNSTINILRTRVLVLSLHIIGHDLLFSNCNKNSITRLRSLYITFYLRCKCVTLLDARTHRNAKKRFIKICLLLGQRRDIYE